MLVVSIALGVVSALVEQPAPQPSPALTLNTTSVTSGDAVHVSWEAVFKHNSASLRDIQEHRTVWLSSREADEEHVEAKCGLIGTGVGSYWVGQFSPAVTSLSDVKMTGSPLNRGISTEGTPPFTTPAPVKFISGTQLANGDYTFIVTNMRTTVNWVLFNGSLSDPSNFQPLALSPTVTFADAAKPMHGRLARTSSTDEMRVTWTSIAGGCSDCHVSWGTDPDNLSRLSDTPDVTTYQASDLCGFPANESGFHSPGDFHTVVLDLSSEPEDVRSKGMYYYYKFGSDSVGWSSVSKFLAPKPANANAAMSIVVTADMGETYEDGSQYHWEEPAAVNTTKGIAALFEAETGVDVLLHAGDLSYATGYESEWDRFMEQIEPLARSAPYMTGQGNHERDFPGSGNFIGSGDSGGECGVPTQGRFHMPVCPEPNTRPCIGVKTDKARTSQIAMRLGGPAGPTGPQNDGWYSFDQGSVHFVMINTEMSSMNGSSQYQFVDNDLASVDRSITPWVLLFGHRQMYSGSAMGPQNDLGDLEVLLLKHKVDIALWGHIHFAQLSCPMYKAKCITTKDASGYDAPVHAVIGNAGQGLVKVGVQVPWSVYNEAAWGFSHIQVYNATNLELKFFNDAALGEPNPLRQTLSLTRMFPRV